MAGQCPNIQEVEVAMWRKCASNRFSPVINQRDSAQRIASLKEALICSVDEPARMQSGRMWTGGLLLPGRHGSGPGRPYLTSRRGTALHRMRLFERPVGHSRGLS